MKEGRKIQNEIKRLAILDKELGFDLPFNDFIWVMLQLTSQSYGFRIPNRFMKEFNLEKVSSNLNLGDCKDKNENYYEVKCSLVTVSNPQLNFVQIRLWQKVKGYICITVNTLVDPMKTEIFYLDREQMTKECELMSNSAHGTIEANKNNENKELRFSLSVDPNDFNYIRWKNYSREHQFSKLNSQSIFPAPLCVVS